jgi:hypothetical protein
MNHIHIGDLRRADDAVNTQVTFRRRRLADANRLVRHLHMHRIGVHLRINGDGADVQLLAGANNPNRNFSAIGNQNFFKHGF